MQCPCRKPSKAARILVNPFGPLGLITQTFNMIWNTLFSSADTVAASATGLLLFRAHRLLSTRMARSEQPPRMKTCQYFVHRRHLTPLLTTRTRAQPGRSLSILTMSTSLGRSLLVKSCNCVLTETAFETGLVFASSASDMHSQRRDGPTHRSTKEQASKCPLLTTAQCACKVPAAQKTASSSTSGRHTSQIQRAHPKTTSNQ